MVYGPSKNKISIRKRDVTTRMRLSYFIFFRLVSVRTDLEL